ncbi:MAG TPA: hypothetical protein VGS02_09850 [Acidobacteriaceae bacterium]|nr:hypothetical protein [Acidobacteriaceae bacterium]
MQPRDLSAGSFAGYPPQGRALAIAHLDTLRQLPLALVPGLLREVIDYDYLFPAERTTIEKQLAALSGMGQPQLSDSVHGFEQISLSRELRDFDWINHPAQFLEQQSAWLWSTHQLDTFHTAANDYASRLDPLTRVEAPALRRLGIAVIGQGVASWDQPLFRNLRAQGTWFYRIKPENGLRTLLDAAGQRARTHQAPYTHWYIDGGAAADHDAALTTISFSALEPLRTGLLKKMQKQIERPGMGPEQLRTWLGQLTPAELGIDGPADPVLTRFQVSLFTEASGTQIFSTTFAQWTTREVLRRAQALTVIARFAPRQRQRPMNELLSGDTGTPELDPAGSLVDADMGAWYHWVNQQRLPGDEHSSFIAWFEDHNQAVAIGPTVPRGVESDSSLDLSQLLAVATG